MAIVEINDIPTSEPLRFPDERKRVAVIQRQRTFLGVEAILWAKEMGLIDAGQITCAEVAPTLRCPERCDLCPDSMTEVEKRISKGLIPRKEPRADTETMLSRIGFLAEMGIEHYMFVGGTIDNLSNLDQLIEGALAFDGVRVSWFTDCIPQTNEDGTPSNLMKKKLERGWLKKVSTHVSIDYPYGYEGIIPSGEILPPKGGRANASEDDERWSRIFKSQYSAIGALNLIHEGVRRVVFNTTISRSNVQNLDAIYEQVKAVQEYVTSNNLNTEVLWTFSPLAFRAHQARGDGPEQSPASAGLQNEDMPQVNNFFKRVLEEEHARIKFGQPRLAANSSGYMNLMADPEYSQTVIDQDVNYNNGRPVILNVTPTGEVWCDPMFAGPELSEVRQIFGYLDREPKPNLNIFTRFTDQSNPWFSNVVST